MWSSPAKSGRPLATTPGFDDVQLAKYLSADLVELKKNLAGVEQNVVKTFNDSFLDESSNWPYELIDDRARDRSSPQSFSTTAMIAFALSLVSGGIRTSSLAPAAALTHDLRKTPSPSGNGASSDCHSMVSDHVDAALRALIADSKSLKADKVAEQHGLKKLTEPPMTNSGTFGADDPFTLTWLLEVLRSRDVDDAFVTALRTRAEQRVKNRAGR